MRSVIRLQAGHPYIELIHTHTHPKSAAEDALEIFFNSLDTHQYCEDPVIPVAKYYGKVHSDSLPSESKVTVEMMSMSEAMKFFAEQSKRLVEIGKSREMKVSPEEEKVATTRRRIVRPNLPKA